MEKSEPLFTATTSRTHALSPHCARPISQIHPRLALVARPPAFARDGSTRTTHNLRIQRCWWGRARSPTRVDRPRGRVDWSRPGDAGEGRVDSHAPPMLLHPIVARPKALVHLPPLPPPISRPPRLGDAMSYVACITGRRRVEARLPGLTLAPVLLFHACTVTVVFKVTQGGRRGRLGEETPFQ